MTPYAPEFFTWLDERASRSARAILAHLYGIIRPQSVVDVGCGVGSWLAAFHDLGVTDILGIDGEYVDRDALRIPAECFRTVDLSRPFSLGRAFDLAVCLEVAEHLPEPGAEGFVQSLCRLAPVILFSAAVPKQGGTNQVNERWPSYWQYRFGLANFVMLDAIRPRIWQDQSIESWYRQNIFLIVRRDLYEQDARFMHLPVHVGDLLVIARRTFEAHANPGLAATVQRLPSLVGSSTRRQLTRLLRRHRSFVSPKPAGPRVRQVSGQQCVLDAEHVSFSGVQVDSEQLCGYSIDSATPGPGSMSHLLCITGWVLGRSVPVIALAFVYKGSVCWQTPMQVARPDVATVFPAVRDAEWSGFSTCLDVPDAALECELEIQAVLADQRCIQLGIIHVRRAWRPSAHRSTG